MMQETVKNGRAQFKSHPFMAASYGLINVHLTLIFIRQFHQEEAIHEVPCQ